MTVTSQPKIENSNWLPVSWSYEEKSILSMCAVYTPAELQSAEDELPLETQVNSINLMPDTVFILLIICGETIIFVKGKNLKKK